MNKFNPAYIRLLAVSFLISCFTGLSTDLNAQINFAQSELDMNGMGTLNGVTSLMYGPDGRLYVAEYPGLIKILTVQRNGLNDYDVIAIETLTDVKDIINYDDDGTACSGDAGDCTSRETTGITVGGTPSNPVFYVSSSDFRIGAGSGGGNGDVDLDTNSGIITRFSWNGSSWDVVDIVRGLTRSEENHATNGLELATIGGTNYLIVAQGGHTNAGSPSENFVYTCEYALSGAVLSIDLDALDILGVQTDGNGRDYILDLPTLDDPTRANANGITDPDTPGYNGIDVNDPFGGNDGLNQAIVDPTGPVQIFSPGYRNAYDFVITESGAVYVTDNGANGSWGGFPVNEGGINATNQYDPAEPGSNSPSGGEQINNLDHLQLVTTDIQNYTFGSLYGGHPNPIRANPNGAGLYTDDGINGGVWRSQVYDPDGSTPGSTTNANLGLPANWSTVVPAANGVEGDWRGPGINNPDGPDDNPIVTWGTNTNGIDEYTASNFGGAMQGNLIAGVNTGVLRRVELDGSGGLQTLTANFLSGIGGNALGISCNSDTDPFAGTIWAGTLNGKIVVFEPDDLVNCIDPGQPGYDPNDDYDNDGYTNQDEEDNNTDPCNGGSQPTDFDKSAGAPLVSDLNDTDDDNDGILDQNDPMQLGDPDAGGSDAFNLPIQNGLFNDQQGLGGIFGLGLTGLMNNGDPNPNWLDWIDDRGQGPNPDDVLGGAPGLMTSHMTSGTANGATNTQEKGYQYGVQVDQTTGIFTVSGRLQDFDGPLALYGNAPASGGELGFFIGDGTQSNFIKFVVNINGLSALQEINDVPQTAVNLNIPVPNRPNTDVVFYFVVDPSNGLVTLEYSIDGGTRTAMSSTITAQGSILTAIQQSSSELMVGFIGTSAAGGVELEGTWDFLNVLGSTPIITQTLPDIDRLINDADEDIDLSNYFDDDNGIGNLTFTATGTDPSIGLSVAGNILTISYPAAAAVSDVTIRATDADTNFVEQTFTVNVTNTPIALYRVNAGGPQISAIDSGIDWEEDTPANNSQYLTNPGSNNAFGYGMTGYTPEVDLGTTPTTIFDTERGDISAGTPNMTYSFPVAQDGNYEVRLYIGNGWPGTSEAGERIFDASIEGLTYPLLNNIDLSGTYGHEIGAVMSHIIYVGDGSIDISFIHDIIENPIVNGIEILNASNADLPIYVAEVPDQTSNVGEQLDGSLVVQALGGDGNLNYTANNLPPGITIEPTNGQIGGTISAGAEAGSPYSVSVTVDDNDASSADEVTINFQWNIVVPTGFRINAGGANVTATDNGPDWRFNDAQGAVNGGIYTVNTGFVVSSGLLNANRHNSVPAYVDETVFDQLFAQERYDVPNAPEMEFVVPVVNGDFVVNLYVGNSFEFADQIGDRIFDINIEGVLVEDNLDLIAQFGHEVGGMLSYPITVTDGEVNILFIHDVENPIINAIEILSVDNSNPTLTLSGISNQINDVNDAVNLTASATGGDPGESISYYIAGQPAGVSINETSGAITGTIDPSATTGGPNNNGIHSVVVTATKIGSAPSSQVFTWTISQTWVDKDEDENYTARHENSFVQAGDKFYLMGGRENSQTVDIYDYTSDSWSSLVNSAPFAFNHFQATEYQGLIWLIGMFKDNAFPNEAPAEFIWAFDPANQEWIQGPQIPAGRRRGSAGLALYNDMFYVVGGNTDGHDGGYVPWFDVYDPATGIWTQLADAPRARDHFAAAIIGDNLYLASGRITDFPSTFGPTIPEVDVYDLVGGNWSTLPAGQNIPTTRAGASVVNFNDRLVVIGGETETAGPSLTVTEEYDPIGQSWRNMATLNSPRHGTQAIVSGNGIFILAGSPVQGGGNQKNMEYLGEDNPVGTPSAASTVQAPAAVQILDGDTEDIEVAIVDGNVGVFVTSMVLSGPDAGDFVIQAGELTNQLLNANSLHTISVQLTGTGADRNAVLTINYGNSSSVDIILSNNNLPPNVINPGNQFNNENDVVNLQIEATDASTNLLYKATGLPPNLVIDPNTGLISGTIEDGTGGGFLEENGLVVVEAESGVVVPDWSLTTAGGATGIIAGTDHFSNQDGGTIPYQINITTPGVYRFNWRNFYSGSNPTEENDNWLRFPNINGVWFFGYQGSPGSEAALISELEGAQNNIVFPKGSPRVTAGTTPAGTGSNGYFKVYKSSGGSETYTWQAFTNDNLPYNIYVRFENAGVYTMEISERSAGHAIDRFALYKVDGQSYSDAELTAAPESQQSGGNGAAENSPYNVEITVTDDGTPPLDSQVQFIWTIGDGTNEPPVAVAEAIPLSGDAPLNVNFIGSNSTDDVGIVSYSWDFMDGSPISTEADPAHIFTDPGVYDVELTVTDIGGFTDTDVVTISVNDPVNNEPPVAVAEADPTSGIAPLEVTFTGSNSTDDVGIISYLWDFDDGGATSTSSDTEHTFTTAGDYTVSLTVTDGGGLEDTTTVIITVIDAGGNEPPVALADATPLSGDAPLQVTFTGSNSTDDVGVVSYLWDFMDGGNTSADADPIYTFADPGTYDVTLTVTDGEGLMDTDIITITVMGNQAPVAVAEATPLTGDSPLDVSFTGSNSTDDVGVVSYLWEFMDGGNTSTDADPMYTFNTDGTYNVTLTVTDIDGLTDTATITIVVGQSANMPPTAVIDADNFSGPAPLTVNFIGRNSVDDFGITSYEWDFGDGTTSTEVDPAHTYTGEGEYTVTLTVTDAGGLVNTATVLIRVDPEEGKMKGIILENPANDGIAQVQVINKPTEIVVMFIYLHDSSGRLVASHLAQDILVTGGTYEIPIGTLRDGLYYIGLVMDEGDPLLLKLLVKN